MNNKKKINKPNDFLFSILLLFLGEKKKKKFETRLTENHQGKFV